VAEITLLERIEGVWAAGLTLTEGSAGILRKACVVHRGSVEQWLTIETGGRHTAEELTVGCGGVVENRRIRHRCDGR
jgi:hypothetical protein